MRHAVMVVLAGLALAMLAGCGSFRIRNGFEIPRAQVRAEPAGRVVHAACTHQSQAGCWEQRVLNFRFDPGFSGMAGLDRPYRSREERQWRKEELAPYLWREYQAGRVSPSTPRSFYVCVYRALHIAPSQLSAYQVNGARNAYRHSVTEVPVEEVTATDSFRCAIANGASPSQVFRIRADGREPIGASIQFPWAMFTDESAVLVCSGDRLTVYPNRITKHEGLWVLPENLRWLRERNVDRTIEVFLSRDG
ncbi:MAG TPA: hypothetical protein VFS75_04005 [Candidatus Paceibacterota bacterium]|nr:hypothetical protein [Candidatus Paceibacterota bacterium]